MPPEAVKTADDPRLLSRMELVERWVAIYRQPPPKGVKRGLLERAIGWHRTAKEQGGLPAAIARQLVAAPSGRDPVAPLRRVAIDGTRLVREWGGRTHVVDVTADGCVWNGRSYPSLSAVALAITGARWSGPRFFGVRQGNGR